MALVLYSYYRSSCSYRVRIALAYKDLDFTYRDVHLVKDGGQQHSADYRKLNPMRQVPSLEHNGRVLSESMAILEYLDDLAPETPLFPSDPYQRAVTRSICEMINSGIQPLQNLKVLTEIQSRFGGDRLEWARYWITRGFESLEQALAHRSGEYCVGDQFSAADCLLVPQVYNAKRFQVDVDAFPRIAAIDAHCLTRADVQQAHPSRQPDTPEQHRARD